jgi:DNA-binding CsgD family transcriptional regulator
VEAGIFYCEENNLNLWMMYMLVVKSKLALETGDWNVAWNTADKLLEDKESTKITTIFTLTILATIKMRRGNEKDILPQLTEAMDKAFEAMEPQRIFQALIAFLEYEWITGQQFIDKGSIDTAMKMMDKMGNIYVNSELAFWLKKARKIGSPMKELYEGYDVSTVIKAAKAAVTWNEHGCPYNEALALFEGKDDDKRRAISIVQDLGASAVYEKMKQDMKSEGIKNIPRGLLKTTRANPAFLTDRELDVLKQLKEGLQNKEIAAKLFISVKTVDHHISSILFKLDVNSRIKAVTEALRMGIIK